MPIRNFSLRLIFRPILWIFILQLLTGIWLILFYGSPEMGKQITHLLMLLLMFILGWYLWLVPYFLVLWWILRFMALKQWQPGFYIAAILAWHFAFFMVVYNGNFFGPWKHFFQGNYSRWWTSERIDLFFFTYAFLSTVVQVISLKRNYSIKHADAA